MNEIRIFAAAGRLKKTVSPESTSETIEQFAAYNKAFFYFNEKLFSGKLKPVMLNFSRRSPRVLGFFAPQRWMKVVKQKNHPVGLNIHAHPAKHPCGGKTGYLFFVIIVK